MSCPTRQLRTAHPRREPAPRSTTSADPWPAPNPIVDDLRREILARSGSGLATASSRSPLADRFGCGRAAVRTALDRAGGGGPRRAGGQPGSLGQEDLDRGGDRDHRGEGGAREPDRRPRRAAGHRRRPGRAGAGHRRHAGRRRRGPERRLLRAERGAASPGSAR